MLSMEERAAFTSGGMRFLTAEGKTNTIPAGACSLTLRKQPARYLVRWQEAGFAQSAEISEKTMIGYLRGCIVQYA